ISPNKNNVPKPTNINPIQSDCNISAIRIPLPFQSIKINSSICIILINSQNENKKTAGIFRGHCKSTKRQDSRIMWESCLFLVIIKVIKRRVGIMLQKQQTMILSPYTEIYDLVVPKDNFLRRLNELIDFSFVYD